MTAQYQVRAVSIHRPPPWRDIEAASAKEAAQAYFRRAPAASIAEVWRGGDFVASFKRENIMPGAAAAEARREARLQARIERAREARRREGAQ